MSCKRTPPDHGFRVGSFDGEVFEVEVEVFDVEVAADCAPLLRRRCRTRQSVNAVPPANSAASRGHLRVYGSLSTRSMCRRALSCDGSPSK